MAVRKSRTPTRDGIFTGAKTRETGDAEDLRAAVADLYSQPNSLLDEFEREAKAAAAGGEKDAPKILNYLERARGFIEQGNAHDAACMALMAGYYSMIAQIRPLERDILQHQKLKVSKRKSNSVTDATRAAWRRAAEGIKTRNPRLSKSAIAAEIAKGSGHAARTVRKHI